MTTIEREASLDAEVTDEIGCQDLSGVGGATDPAGQSDRRPEQVVVVVDRFAGGDPDPYPKFRVLGVGCSCREPSLDCHRALHRARPIVERGHDPVAPVLHLASVSGHERSIGTGKPVISVRFAGSVGGQVRPTSGSRARCRDRRYDDMKGISGTAGFPFSKSRSG